MNTNLKPMLWQAFATVVFIGALTVALYQVQFVQKSIQTTYITGKTLDHNVAATLNPSDVYTVNSSVVLQSIYHIEELQVDIQVDGHLYPKTIKIEHADLSKINRSKQYVSKRVRGPKGELIRIDYESTPR
ncbi:hypothetical protein NV379_05460 [Paenibacillus sp. N1-5-1-14]|uniref:hypothetical protein n=1 Tax=Paenibacillus radicibacter TaxID=2972488 RepID=UPI002159A258|nr:hypothetical protein [Paenibacillus radicibacter]MCR8642100.1 hypothetical protein [Paenibacillus radicibacter]